jgi:hypothetical protein
MRVVVRAKNLRDEGPLNTQRPSSFGPDHSLIGSPGVPSTLTCFISGQINKAVPTWSTETGIVASRTKSETGNFNCLNHLDMFRFGNDVDLFLLLIAKF